MAAVAAVMLLVFPGAFVQVGVILGGCVVGWFLYRKAVGVSENLKAVDWKRHLAGGGLLVLFFTLLIQLP